MILDMPWGWGFSIKQKSSLGAFLGFLTKDEDKFDDPLCFDWPKTTLKTPKNIFPIQSADVHTTSC